MMAIDRGSRRDVREGYEAAADGAPWDIWRSEWWQQGWRDAMRDGQCRHGWQVEHARAPWIDDWSRLDAFASVDPFRRELARPWLQLMPNGEAWSLASCGRLLVAYRRAVKWIEPNARTSRMVDKEKLWPWLRAVDQARSWWRLTEVELPAPEMEVCEDFWTTGDAELDAEVVMGEGHETRPMTFEEAVDAYGEDAEAGWAPWEKSVRFPICGRDVAVPFLRRLRAWLPGARIALDVNPGAAAPLAGDFMGGLGRWLAMPMRRDNEGQTRSSHENKSS